MLTEGEIYPPSSTDIPRFPNDLPSAPISTAKSSLLRLTYPTPVKISNEDENAEEKENCAPNSETVTTKDSENSLVSASEKAEGLIDASHLVNYNTYRHKLIEETLQKRYGGGYAPGNVILNLIELNTSDSAASVILGKKYDGSFFEHIKPQEQIIATVGQGSCRLDLEHPDPLVYFIPRNVRKPSTLETQTETANPSETSITDKVSVVPSRPTTPGSCQRILSKRFNDGSLGKSPFVTPVHSQAPINTYASLTARTRDHRSDALAPGRAEEQFVCSTPIVRLREAPLTEQLYRRNEASPDVVSKTHVEAEEYLNRIARNRKFEIATKPTVINKPRIRSSLKKSKQQSNEGRGSFCDREGGKVSEKTGECNQQESSVTAADLRHLSTSKPTVWNN